VLTVLLLLDTVHGQAPPTALTVTAAQASRATASDLISRALQANRELAAARLDLERGRARLRQAGLRPNPIVDLEQTTGRFTGSRDERDLSVGVALPIELGAKRQRRIDLAEAELVAVEAEIANRERQLTREVLGALADTLAALRELETTNGVRDLDEQTMRVVRTRVDERDAPPLELSLLLTENINDIVEAIVAGKEAGLIYQGEQRFGLVVRFDESTGRNEETIRSLVVPAPNGARVPLSQLAEISLAEGPAQISREDTRRRIAVELNVRGRDIGSFVAEAQEQTAAQVPLAPGYYVTWGGQFENLQRASARLLIVVPIALVLIFILLFSAFGSLRQALIVYTGIPFAIVGGVFALALRGLPFSISAGVGFIALFGVAVLNGVVMVSYINELRAKGRAVRDAVMEGAETRLRPVLMTALVASLGFVPMALATSAGAEVQRPLATVVIGGLVTSTALSLLILPMLCGRFERDAQ
jgi:cobalt-zinc-cadmium resistance protein CzcA